MNRIIFLLCVLIVSAGRVDGQALKPKLDLYGDPLPPGAAVRFGTVGLRHAGVMAMAFSADGRRLLSFGHDGAIRTWDPATGRMLDEKPLPTIHHIRNAALSPDGKVLAFRDTSGAYCLWDVMKHRLGHRLPVRIKAGPGPMQFSPDGTTLITTDESGIIDAWDVREGTSRVVGDHKSEITCVIFARGGQFLTVGENWSVRLWDLKKNKELLATKLDQSVTTDTGCGLISHDDKVLAIHQNGKLAFLDLATFKKSVDWKTPNDGTYRFPRFSLDGKTVFLSNKGNVVHWDPMAGKVLQTLPGGTSRNLIISPDRKFAAAFDGDRYNAALFTWDLTSGTASPANDPARGHLVEFPTATAISNDGRMIASRSLEDICTWDASTGRLLGRAVVTDPLEMAFSNDDRSLFVSTIQAIVQLDAVSLKKIRSFVLPEKTMGKPNFGRIGISDDGRRLTAIWYRGGRPGNYACITWRLPTGEQSRVMPVSVVDGSLYGGRFSKDNTILVGHDGRIVAVDTGRELIELEVNGWTVSTPSAISNDGNLIAFRLEEKTADKKTPPKKFAVQVWEMVTFQPVCRLPTDNMGHLAFVGNRCLVSIGLNSFRIWDLAHEKETWIRSVPSRSPYGNSFASAFAISRDGSKIVTGQTDSTLLRWDFPAPKREKRALTDAEFTQYWTDLGAVDARRAFQAIHHLNADPDKVVPVLRERINWTAPLYQMAPS